MKTKLLFIIIFLYCFPLCFAQDRAVIPIPKINLNVEEASSPQDVALSLQILFLLSILTLAPSIIILCTSFLRIAIIFNFVKRALSLQQMPPDQILMGLALFLSLFVMWPTLIQINDNALQPFLNNKLEIEGLYDEGISPIRTFMFKQTKPSYIAFFLKMRGMPRPRNYDDVPTYILIPAFVISELTIAFQIGVLLFIPFIIIDIITASTLMSMGMIMLPPIMISLPFKIILFVLVDGWQLLTYNIYNSFVR